MFTFQPLAEQMAEKSGILKERSDNLLNKYTAALKELENQINEEITKKLQYVY